MPDHRVGLYNWSDEAKTIRVLLSDAQLERAANLELAPEVAAKGVTLKDGAVAIQDQPAHSFRIVSLLDRK
jgi:hypothetical protein